MDALKRHEKELEILRLASEVSAAHVAFETYLTEFSHVLGSKRDLNYRMVANRRDELKAKRTRAEMNLGNAARNLSKD